jgi:imidazolonepropionase-like amidohydrolase
MPGMSADLAFFEAADYRELCYYFGDSQCRVTVKRGEVVFDRGQLKAGGKK